MLEEIAIVLGILLPSAVAIYLTQRKYSKQLKQLQENNTTLRTTIQSEAQRTFEEWKQTQLTSLQEQYKTQIENAKKKWRGERE
jgi:type II secretory pathway pseudopilin PulG